MNAKEAIEKIRKMLFQEQKAAEAKLADSTLIRMEGDLSEGARVTTNTSEGESPLADGEHELEDGTPLMVKDGIARLVNENEEEKELTDKVETAVQQAMERFSARENEISMLKTDFELHRKAFRQMLDIVEKLTCMPEGTPAKKVSSPFSKQADKDARFNEMAKTLKGMRIS